MRGLDKRKFIRYQKKLILNKISIIFLYQSEKPQLPKLLYYCAADGDKFFFFLEEGNIAISNFLQSNIEIFKLTLMIVMNLRSKNSDPSSK